jgi:hypothetical protein
MGAVEEHYQMEDYFPYFPNIQACLPGGLTGRSPELADLVYGMFPDSKTVGGNHILLGLLRICLPQTPPFQDTAEDKIRDVRDENRLLPCPQRFALIEKLAVALLQYHYNCQKVVRELENLRETRKYDLSTLRTIVKDFQHLRAKEALPAVGKRLPTNRAINKAHQVFTEMITAISDAGQNLNTSKAAALLPLCLDMKDAFEKYVPRVKNVETYNAIAAILIALGVEQGERPTVARRIQKRLQRASGS